MPRSRREALASIVVLELLLKGVHFDSKSIWGLPFRHTSISRAFKGLVEAGVISKSHPRGKYRLTDGFREMMRVEITRDAPRGLFVHYPDFAVFDISGIGDWTEEELDWYVERLRERWMIRRKQAEGLRTG
jgi:hypothetical protein